MIFAKNKAVVLPSVRRDLEIIEHDNNINSRFSKSVCKRIQILIKIYCIKRIVFMEFRDCYFVIVGKAIILFLYLMYIVN